MEVFDCICSLLYTPSPKMNLFVCLGKSKSVSVSFYMLVTTVNFETCSNFVEMSLVLITALVSAINALYGGVLAYDKPNQAPCWHPATTLYLLNV